MKEIGIYIHIPFCKSKCFYCDFNSFEGKEDKIEEYINTLLIEIESCAKTNFNVKSTKKRTFLSIIRFLISEQVQKINAVLQMK